MKRSAFIKLALKLAVSLLILWYASSHFAWRDAWRLVISGSPAYFLMSVVWALLSAWLAAWRWDLLAGGAVGIWRATRLVLVSLFFGLFLPGSVSADVIRGAHLAIEDPDHRNASTAACILADRVIGLIVMLFLVLIAGLGGIGGDTMHEVWSHIMWWIGGALVVLLGGAIATLTTRGRAIASKVVRLTLPGVLSDPLLRLISSAAGPWPGPRALLLVLLASLLNQACGIMSVSALCDFIGQDISFAQTAVFFCLSTLSTVIPVTIAGVGIRDWIAVRVFSNLSGKAEAGAAISMSILAVMLCVAAIGGIIYAMHSPASRGGERPVAS